MAIIKCKMCGGDIEISADKTFGTCEYCGSTMTLPKTDDDQRLSLFNRGTHLRRNGEFDKAAAIYERLIGENDADAEAHWNLLLCRYGIEYVQDPASGERIPTCHRASFDSILNDVDYQAALQYSDGVARSLYEKEAQRIAALQKDILAISQKEAPFDVFICYKESDESGKRTKDSALAQDIYYQLTDAGYKVFFARITLEDKLGQEYEPYIFAALHSAKVMVVVGTKPEYLNAVWVKNEWSRYLALMRTDRSRLLIPCYRDMDPYDMPEELSMLQSQDMGKIGFIQDLIRGVKKVVDAAKPQETAAETVKETVVVHNEGGSNVQALLKRGNMALEDGEWTKADEFFEQVLNQDAECGAAYLGKFLASEQCRSAKAYADAFVKNVKADAPGEKNAYACEEDEAFAAACVEKYTLRGILSAVQIREALDFDLGYCVTSDYYALRAEEAQEQFAADKDLMRATKYASSEVKTITEDIPQTLDTLRRDAQKREDAEKARVTAEYRKFLTDTEARLEKEHPQRLKEAQAQKKAAAKTKRTTTIALSAAAAIIAVVLLITKVIIPSSNYSKAEEMLAVGEYDGAIEAFTALGDYKDAAERITQIEEQQENERLAREAAEEEARNAQAYADAEALLANGDYDGAAEAFEALGGYQDAAERAQDCPYIEAEQLLAQGKTAEASIAFGRIAGYKDALERSFALRASNDPTIIAESDHIVALKEDGTAVAIGNNEYGQCDVADWTNLVAIDAGFLYTVGLKADGTVLAAGYNDDGRCNVSDWTDITAIRAGSYHTVGLKTNGTVVAVGDNDLGQCDVADWTDITAISAREHHTVGLKADGTVVAVGYNDDGRCNVSDWTDITAIRAGSYHTVGLKADGTVVAAGNNKDGQCDVSDWTDIVAIKATYKHTVGLKADGTVVAVGFNKYGQCDVSDWTDIIAIDAATSHTVGLKADGTVVAIGNNGDGQCNVSDWKDILAVNAGGWDTVGLKADGTVVVVGGNVDDKCNASGWTNIKLPNK